MEHAAADAGQLFRQHSHYVAALLLRSGVHPSAVDDGVQSVFIVANHYGGYRPGAAAPRTWLGAIAIRIAANMRRARQRKIFSEMSYARYRVASTPSQDAQLGQEQAVARLRAELDAIPAHYRDALLSFAMGYTCEDIAAELDIPVGTVYSRLHTARKLLRAAYDD